MRIFDKARTERAPLAAGETAPADQFPKLSPAPSFFPEQARLASVIILNVRAEAPWIQSRQLSSGEELDRDISNSGLNGFEKAYMAHKDRLLTLAAAIVGDKVLAEDVVHDVFLNLAKDPARLEDLDNPGGYLTVAARNRAISLLRVRQRRADLVESASAAGSGKRAADPGERAAQTEESRTLLRLVNELPQSEREAVALRIWGELGFREIAQIQGATASTVHSRYRQALEKLRLALARGSRS